jgi:very-short-patch-repair endonuclease
METRLRLLLVRSGLPEPVIGYAIRDRNGDFIGTPDLTYVDQRIAIEYEGAVHRDDPRVFAGDILRRELMQEADWYVIRVISDHVFRSPEWLVGRIRRILAQRSLV